MGAAVVPPLGIAQAVGAGAPIGTTDRKFCSRNCKKQCNTYAKLAIALHVPVCLQNLLKNCYSCSRVIPTATPAREQLSLQKHHCNSCDKMLKIRDMPETQLQLSRPFLRLCFLRLNLQYLPLNAASDAKLTSNPSNSALALRPTASFAFHTACSVRANFQCLSIAHHKIT